MKLQRKICDSEIKEFDEKDLSVVHFISSELPDRGGDVLHAAKNDKGAGMIMLGRPVVLQQHGWGEMGMEPIAKPIWIRASKFKDRDGIECKTQFFPDELGKRLFKKTSGGYMPNWSVGWMPMEGKIEMVTNEEGKEIRHVYEWELLEYSIVGVPMQPDAQTRGEEDFFFKMIPEQEDKFGELVGWKKDDFVADSISWEEKPYPNEHACRLEDPDKYIRIRRQNDKFGKGIHAIWGVQEGSKPVELQAIRFAKSKFTAAEARAWLKDHKYKCKLFEPASEKCEKCGKPMLIKWGQDVSGDKCKATCEASFSYVHDGDCGKSGEVICQGCEKPVKYADVPESGMGYIKCPNCGKLIDQTGKILDEKATVTVGSDVCSCDGEVDDKDVCKVCNKPKPEKSKKEKTHSLEEEIAYWLCQIAKDGFQIVSSDVPLLASLSVKYPGLLRAQKGIKQTADEDGLFTDPCSDEDVGFVVVDADAVRKDNGTEDFIHGGHHYVFAFIPEPEIWIDERMTDEDIMSLKISLFVERQMMKYCSSTSLQCKEIGSISGKLIGHVMDSEMEGGGHHDEKDAHYFEHGGNHFHSRGQTLRWDNEAERYNVHSLLIGELVVSLTEEQKEAFEKDVDEAIKQVAAKYGLQETPPAEPEAGKEKPAINPPEPRKVIIITEEDRKRSEQERQKQVSEMFAPVIVQIEEAFKKIPTIVKEEIDRLRGRVK